MIIGFRYERWVVEVKGHRMLPVLHPMDRGKQHAFDGMGKCGRPPRRATGSLRFRTIGHFVVLAVGIAPGRE